MVRILQADKLQSAEEVGDLKQPIVGGNYFSELRLRKQDSKDRSQQFIQLDLSVIVVNDNLIKPGKEGVFLTDERRELFGERNCQAERIRQVLFLNRKGDIGNFTILGKRQNTVQASPTLCDGKALIIFLAANDRSCVKAVMNRKADVGKTALQMTELVFYGVALVMEYKRKEIEWRVRFVGAKVPRLVHKYAKFPHPARSLQKKMAGNIPAAGGPGSEDQPVSLDCIISYFPEKCKTFFKKSSRFSGGISTHS